MRGLLQNLSALLVTLGSGEMYSSTPSAVWVIYLLFFFPSDVCTFSFFFPVVGKMLSEVLQSFPT